MTALQLAREAGRRVSILEPPEITEYDRDLIDIFWGMRRFADDGDKPVPLGTMLQYLSLSSEIRTEVDLLRHIDVAYLEYIASLKPERRKNLGRLRVVEKEPLRDPESDEDES